MEVQAAVIDSNWVGGSSGEWDQASNWDPNIVPDNTLTDTFVVIIDSNSIGVDDVLVWLQQNRTINKLDCYGAVCLMQSGPYRTWTKLTLAEVEGLTNHGELYIEDDITIAGNVTNSTGAEIEFGQSSIVGNLDNHAGATFLQESESGEIYGNATNAGEIRIEPTAQFYANPYFRNIGQVFIDGGVCEADQILDNNSTGVIQGFGVLDVEEQSLQNKGQIIASGGTLSVLNEGSITNTGTLANKALSTLNIRSPNNVNNLGTIEVNAGGGVAFDCNVVNEPNAIIKLLGGTLAATTITQRADANFEGFGGITGDVVIDHNGIIELTGTTNIVGDVNISPNATLEISDGATLITGRTVCNGTIHIKGGYLIPQGGLSGDCNIIWEAGLFTNPADFNLDGEVNFGDFAYFAETWLWKTGWY